MRQRGASRGLIAVPLLAACTIQCATVHAAAQTAVAQPPPDPSYFTRAEARWEEQLSEDTVLGLMASKLDEEAFSARAMLKLPDSALASFFLLFDTTLAQIGPERCGSVLRSSQRGDSLMQFMSLVDSATVDHWLGFFEQVIYAEAYGWPERPGASPEEVEKEFFDMVAHLATPDSVRLVSIQQGGPRSLADDCWLGRLVIRHMATRPAGRAGPLLRGMYGSKGAKPDP